MTTVTDIFKELCALAPLEMQMGFDNAGFLVGHREARVGKALLSLDVTTEVINEAIEKECSLIISHHPVIWDAMKSVTDEGVSQRKILKLIENGIAVISMHTNLDIAEGGVNDALIALVGAECTGSLDTDGCGRTGVLAKAVSMAEFVPLCKERLRSNGIRYYDAGRPVSNIAVMGGAGGGSILRAYELGCDTYLTSDVKYDHFLLARELKINLIDGDHFCTEKPVMEVIRKKLSDKFKNVDFYISDRHTQTAMFF